MASNYNYFVAITTSVNNYMRQRKIIPVQLKIMCVYFASGSVIMSIASASLIMSKYFLLLPFWPSPQEVLSACCT